MAIRTGEDFKPPDVVELSVTLPPDRLGAPVAAGALVTLNNIDGAPCAINGWFVEEIPLEDGSVQYTFEVAETDAEMLFALGLADDDR